MNKKLSRDEGEGQKELRMELRRQKIKVAAYFEAERRGVAPAFESDDWLKAEREVDEASRSIWEMLYENDPADRLSTPHRGPHHVVGPDFRTGV